MVTESATVFLLIMQTPNVLTEPPPIRPFVPAVVNPAPAQGKKESAKVKAQPRLRVVPDFRSPALGLFHRATEGRAVHRWETLIFVLLGLSALLSIALAFFGL